MGVPVLEEEWRPVVGWEGKYWVSNYGQIRGRKGVLKERIGIRGHRAVSLERGRKGKDRISVYLLVHRAVAQAFIPNPNNLPIVNHIDEDPNNNRVDNLEWCTHKYNVNYGSCKEKMSIKIKEAWAMSSPVRRREREEISRRNGARTTSKPVIQLTKEGEFVKEYPNIKAAARATGTNCSHIGEAARGGGRYKTAGGYKWKLKEGE